MPLLQYLRKALHLSGHEAKRLLDSRNVFVNGQRVWMAKHPLAANDLLRIVEPEAVPRREAASAPLLRGEGYLVIDKPAGVPVQGPGSIELRLQRELGNPDIRCVHRLDRETSGCLLVSTDPATREQLVECFAAKEVFKHYHAIVHGRIRADTRSIVHTVGGKRAVTRIRVLDRATKATHIQAIIETGRTHQIRIHMASIHHPVIGDRRYAQERPTAEVAQAAPRQMLHAAKLVFPDPHSGETVRAISPLPPDFRAQLSSCRLK